MLFRAASALAIVTTIGTGLYWTSGNTLLDPSEVANDWENSCHVDVDLRQSGRISLDFSKYGKDTINGTKFALPIACAELDNVEPSDKIVNEFRWGSFITEFGSSSSWDLSIFQKAAVPNGADDSICSLELNLRERHRGILTHTFIKDAWNDQTFDWLVPCDVHDAVPVGHNFVTDPLRLGSINQRMRQESPDWAYGTWNVEVTGHNGPASPGR